MYNFSARKITDNKTPIVKTKNFWNNNDYVSSIFLQIFCQFPHNYETERARKRESKRLRERQRES